MRRQLKRESKYYQISMVNRTIRYGGVSVLADTGTMYTYSMSESFQFHLGVLLF